MKIAFIRRSYNPYGGAERFLEQLIQLLSRQGHEVHIFAHQWKRKSSAENPVVFHKVPVTEGPPCFQVLSFAYSAGRLLKQDRFDVIHGFDRSPFLDLYRAGDGCHRAWLHRQTKDRKTLARLIRDPYHESILSLERQILTAARTRIIACNSRLVEEEIRKYYDVPSEKLRVLHNGVDVNQFHPGLRANHRSALRERYGISDETLVLLFVGSSFERKGLPLAIRSLTRIRTKLDRQIKLIVIGEGAIQPHEALADRLKCKGEILFAGPRRDLRPWYGMADIFVLPTVYDPFSNAAMEALASGLPVVTTRANGVSELMEGKECGFVLEDPLDIQAFASAVGRLADGKVRQKAAELARDAALNFPMERYVEDTLSLYRKLIKD